MKKRKNIKRDIGKDRKREREREEEGREKDIEKKRGRERGRGLRKGDARPPSCLIFNMFKVIIYKCSEFRIILGHPMKNKSPISSLIHNVCEGDFCQNKLRAYPYVSATFIKIL